MNVSFLGSPLLKKTEARRERSRSRQRDLLMLETSELFTAAQDIPAIKEAMEMMTNTYGVIKVRVFSD